MHRVWGLGVLSTPGSIPGLPKTRSEGVMVSGLGAWFRPRQAVKQS